MGLEVCVVGGRERVEGSVVLGDIILDSVGVLEDAVMTRYGCLCVCACVTGLSARECQLCICGKVVHWDPVSESPLQELL